MGRIRLERMTSSL